MKTALTIIICCFSIFLSILIGYGPAKTLVLSKLAVMKTKETIPNALVTDVAAFPNDLFRVSYRLPENSEFSYCNDLKLENGRFFATNDLIDD